MRSRFFFVFSISAGISLFFWVTVALSLVKTDHLFLIERSKNNNFVQYDVQLVGNDDLIDSRPVTVYWVLENGQREELNLIQKKYAYGIASQEKIQKNKFRVLLVVLKNREIIIEKIDGSFRAVVSIDGRESILEKVYVEAREIFKGLPKVLYVDLFGKVVRTHLPVKERIIPE